LDQIGSKWIISPRIGVKIPKMAEVSPPCNFDPTEKPRSVGELHLPPHVFQGEHTINLEYETNIPIESYRT